MKNILYTLALLVSFSSFGQKNILDSSKIPPSTSITISDEWCHFPNYFWLPLAPSHYESEIYRYIKLPYTPQFYLDDINPYFTTLDFEQIKQNKDSLSNKSELIKDNNFFNFEFYKSDNVNTYENPKNLKSFTALLNKKYLEVEMDSFGEIMSFKLINTKGRKKNRFKYTYNGSEFVLDYFDTGNKYALNLMTEHMRIYDKYQLVRSSECDGNKLITKHFYKNGQISILYEFYVETLTDESESRKTILTKYYPSGNISALITTDEIWSSNPLNSLVPKPKDKFLERKRIFEAYSEDGVFSIKNESTEKELDINFLVDDEIVVKTGNINNGEIINVFKKHKNGKKEIYSKIKWNWNSKKWEKSFKRLIKTLNSF